MSGYVVDASVVIKWTVPEKQEIDTDKALELLTAFESGNAGILQPQGCSMLGFRSC